MVHLTCNCLNIRIHVKGYNDANFDLTRYSTDPFFQNGCSAVTLDLAGITKELQCLIRVRETDNVRIYSCINCRLEVYALLEINGKEMVFVSRTLKSDPTELNALMHQESYSPLYKIIVPAKLHNQAKKDLTLDLHMHRSEALEKMLNSLQNQLTRFLQSEQEAVEERIRTYVEQQRSLYAALQNRVRNDKQAIASLLIESEEEDLQTSLSEAMIDTAPGLTPPMTPVSNNNQLSGSPLQNSGEFREQLNSEENDLVLGDIPKAPKYPRPQSFNRPLQAKLRRKGVYTAPKIAQSLDTDGIFPLDGVEEEVHPIFHYDEGELDVPTDDLSSDEVFTSMPSPMIGINEMFKTGQQMSLPINMPQWNNRHRSRTQSDSDDDDKISRIPDDPAQVVASIKALARSIHQTDTTEMFGDLPRPRLNTMN